MKLHFSLLFLLLNIAIVSAQNFQVISGQLLDKKTGQGIPYANIGIIERGIGTTSNDDGQFTFKVPDYYKNSTLMVSVIGYKTFKAPLKDFTSSVVIELDPTSYQLSEIQIVDENAIENIIRKAVARIPDNYPSYATNGLAFYRESRTNAEDEYLYLAEGVLKIYKTSYTTSKDGMVSLVQGRKINIQNPLDTVIQGGFSSGHMAAHRFDFVKNREDFINEDYFPAYKYWIETVTSYNDREVYVIAFDKDPKAKGLKKKKGINRSIIDRIFGGSESALLDARLKGKVFIDKESYAFVRAEFEVTDKGLKQYDDYPLYSGRWTFNTYVVNYQERDGQWYFSDALREGGRQSGGIFSNEIKMTEIGEGKGKALPYLERLNRSEEFVDMTGRYDENFWKSYNTIPMSEKLSESMQQYKTAMTAEQVFSPKRMQEIQQLRDSITLADLIAQAQKEAAVNEEVFDPELITFGEPGIQQKKRRKYRMETMLGAGTHLISTSETDLGISFLDREMDNVLLTTRETIRPREFEAIYTTGLNIVLNDRWFLRFNNARDFGRTIYRESSSGLGVQFNLSRQRPVYLKFSAHHSRNRYARVVGVAENEEGRISINGKNFNSNRVRIFYGSRTRQLKLSGELSVELKKNREFFVRGSYYLPYAQEQEVFFRETSFLFKKRTKLPVHNDRIRVLRDDQPFSQSLIQSGRWQLTVGYLFK